MAYFAALLYMIDPEKNTEIRPHHIKYLEELEKQGKIFARGPFTDGSGGLVVYKSDTFEEASSLAKNDPYVIEKARKLDLKEWGLV